MLALAAARSEPEFDVIMILSRSGPPAVGVVGQPVAHWHAVQEVFKFKAEADVCSAFFLRTGMHDIC